MSIIGETELFYAISLQILEFVKQSRRALVWQCLLPCPSGWCGCLPSLFVSVPPQLDHSAFVGENPLRTLGHHSLAVPRVGSGLLTPTSRTRRRPSLRPSGETGEDRLVVV